MSDQERKALIEKVLEMKAELAAIKAEYQQWRNYHSQFLETARQLVNDIRPFFQ